jgi:hypothetical protein
MDEVVRRALDRRMRAGAAAGGGRIDASYDGGQPEGEVPPGMLFRAQRKFDLDLTRTTFVGADPRATDAVAFAGCSQALVIPRHATRGDRAPACLGLAEAAVTRRRAGAPGGAPS